MKKKVINVDVDYLVFEVLFNKGNIVLIINGFWFWVNIEKSGINYGVVVFLMLNGKVFKLFVGVLSVVVNVLSLNKDLVKEFLENYFLMDSGLDIMNKDVLLGVVVLKFY